MNLQWSKDLRQTISGLLIYLSKTLNSLPEGHENGCPRDEEAEHEIRPQLSHVLDSIGDVQHVFPDNKIVEIRIIQKVERVLWGLN